MAIGHDGRMLFAGETVLVAGRQFTVNERDLRHVAAMREHLVDVAWAGEKSTYAELVEAAQLPYPARGLGRLLALLSEDCGRRGEPSLACLVVTKESNEVGSGYGTGALEERQRLYAYWRLS